MEVLWSSFQRLRLRGASRCGRLAADGVRVLEAALGWLPPGVRHSAGAAVAGCLVLVGRAPRSIYFDDLNYSLDRSPGEPLVLCPEQSVRVRPALEGGRALCERICAAVGRRQADLIDFHRCDVETPNLRRPPALSLLHTLLLQPSRRLFAPAATVDRT